MKKRLFRLLASFNKAVLPKQWDRDLLRLSKPRQALAGYRYWVTKNAL
ncbi:MAG: SsrA-binding protein [Flavobacteriales bacterium]|nr:SsrA-binding protein [Flavobacteriales bacterium]MCI1751615.1 SsrA-binding protein [Flavobacteriales bacterium]